MIDIQQLRDRLRISYFNADGEVDFKEIYIPKAEKYKWAVDRGGKNSDPIYKSWDDKPVKKENQFFLGKYRIEEFLSSLPESETKEIYSMNVPNKWFCDIEVEVHDSFPEPTLAATPILTIALVDAKEQAITVLGLKDLDNTEIASIKKRVNGYFEKYKIDMTFQYIKFESEVEMMMTFMSKWVKKIPLLTGWNFVGFDWTYIINRCKKLGIDPAKASVNGVLRGDSELPEHKIIVDYLELYKKWDRVVKIKENNKLDTVGRQVLGLEKIKYSGTFMDMYNTNFEEYVYYNIVDTVLVHLIDEEIKTMQTFLMLGSITKVEAMKAFSPIWMTEIVMAREFYKRDQIVAEVKKGVKNVSFEGAYVKKPIVGLHEHIATFDFASLYPSIMRQWNISPEVFKGKDVDEMKEGWIECASGSVFDNNEDSIMRSLLTEYFGKRKVAKGKAFELVKEIDVLEQKLKTM